MRKSGRKPVRTSLASHPGLVHYLTNLGFTPCRIAALFGVSPTSIYHALKFSDDESRKAAIRESLEAALTE